MGFLRNFFNKVEAPEFWQLLQKFYLMYAHRYKARIALLFLGAIISGVLEILGLVLLYVLLRILININNLEETHVVIELLRTVGVQDSTRMVYVMGLTIAFIFIFKNIYVLGYYHYQHLTLRKWKNDISVILMSKYLHAPYLFLLGYNSATLIRNINSIVATALNGFVLAGFNFLANIITGILILSLLYVKYTQITLIVGLVLLISTVAQNYFLKSKAKQIGLERDELMAEQNKNVYQGIHAIKETKVIGKESFFLEAFKGVNFAAMDNDSKNLFYTRLPTHITEIVIIISILLICTAILGEPGSSSASSISSLGVLAAVAFRISPIMNRTLSAVQNMNKNMGTMKILFKELGKMSSFEEKESDLSKIKRLNFSESLLFENIGFRYAKAEKPAVAGVNCEIKKGEFIGVVGQSGAGKTTFTDIILGLIHPVAGSFKVDKTEVTKNNVRSWQKNLSFVPQSIYLNDDSIRKNIAFGVNDDDIDDEKIWSLLNTVQLAEFVSNLPGKLDFVVGENGKHLSGGQKQRIGIARALYLEREVLILDEATSALDVPTESLIADSLKILRGDKTIITIAHRLSTVFNADKIFFMNDSRLVAVGTYKELYNSIPSFKKMADLAKVVPS